MANACLIRPLPASVTANQSDPGFAAANVLNDYAGVVWQTSANYRALTFDFGANVPLDTVLLFGLVNSASNPSVNIYARLDGPNDNVLVVGGAALSAGSAPPTIGKGVFLHLTEPIFLARYIIIEFPSDYNGPFQVGRAVIGRRIRLERNFSYGATAGVRDLGSLDFSARGVLLRRRGAKLRTVGLTFSSIRKDEVETLVQPLLDRLGNTDMVALITDPSPDPQRQNRCYYGPLVGDIGTVRPRAAAYEAKINLVSIF